MAASTVSKDSEGIYTDLASPYQDVYSTLGQTSLNSPGAQHTGHRGLSSHPYRRAAVCLGLLCALLLAATLVLCVLYTSQSGNYSMLETDLEKLRSNCSTTNKEKVHQQKNYSMLERDLDKLRSNCSTTNKEKVQQQGRVCEPCPQGWSQFSSKCYYFSNEKKNWFDSRSDCIKRGADLVIIESEDKQGFITNIAKYHTWIGLSRVECEGNWLWVDGTPLQKEFWGSGEPDDQRRSHCAMIAPGMNG